MSDEERTYRVDLMTRVEGEGSFRLRVKDGEVVESALAIFEAPRFFEAFLRGRSAYEVNDIVARICGICPVAYQTSASRAIERAFGVPLAEPVRRLRRLLYCGEWIESHALHVFMLHAPDFLGYPSVIEMAKDHRAVVERGLSMRKAGNALIALLGGRSVHPVSPWVGGFTKVPSLSKLRAMRPVLERGLHDALETVRWAASLPMPELAQDYIYVALSGTDDYPIESGETIAVSGRGEVSIDDWGEVIDEQQVPYSNALQSRLKDGSSYLCGPMARLFHHAEKLHPRAREAMDDAGLPREVKNPYRSIVVRAVEMAHAFAEAVDLVQRLHAAGSAARALHAPRFDRLRRQRGAPRHALASLRARRRGARRRRAHRAAHLAEPGADRGRPGEPGAAAPRDGPRRGDAFV